VSNSSHDARAEQALKGRTTFVYRGWQVAVYPATLERPNGQRATCEARPFDTSKLPPGRPNARIAGQAYVEGAQHDAQIRLGVLAVLQKVDAVEAKHAAST
jgi:hypothetical protein